MRTRLVKEEVFTFKGKNYKIELSTTEDEYIAKTYKENNLYGFTYTMKHDVSDCVDGGMNKLIELSKLDAENEVIEKLAENAIELEKTKEKLKKNNIYMNP